jgi:hypothetical protein
VLLRRRKKTQPYHLWVGSGQAIDSMIQDRINRVTERLSALFCVKTHALVSFLVPGACGIDTPMMTPIEIFAGVEAFIIRIPYKQILSDSRRSHGRSSDSQTSEIDPDKFKKYRLALDGF